MRGDDISARARGIHFSSLVFDTHADTPQRILFDQFDLARRDSEGCVDIPRMREGGVGAIFFALWVPVEITGHAATQRARDLLDAVLRQVELHSGDLALATTPEEVRRARKENKIAIMLGIEGGHAINNDLDILREFHACGARYLTLTHTAATDWADSSNGAPRHNGLTDFGKQVIREMNRLGMLVDVSHVSDATFYDVLQTSQAPVIASHSCCRALCGVPRNLDDEMIQRLAAAGGMIHITFHRPFLSKEFADARETLAAERAELEKDAKRKFGLNEARKLIEGQRWGRQATLEGKLPAVSWEKIIDHIDHAVRLAGADHVGLGSDFDGAFMPDGLEDAAKYSKITEGLLRRGHGEADIRGILGENTLRVMAEAQRASGQRHAENP
ncbi:MAG TPA: dipeptidase [Candidatus Acidoferrales bacterium]|nr:dipeptidase [Candidatus Acidoferrales bacterium]